MTAGTRRWRRWAVGAVAATALAIGIVLLGPAGAAAAPGAAGADQARVAGHGLTELLSAPAPGRQPLLVSSRRFQAVMGYRPATARLPHDPALRAVKPTGACSSPLGGTTFHFGLACKAHDLGYDLLRFASRTGQPPGPAARRQLDDQLARDLHAQCAASRRGAGRRACDALADLYADGARLNSWRQRYGTP
jgi:hypothetical protein